jgi:hypothetical protein
MNLVSLRRSLAFDSLFWVAPLIIAMVLAASMASTSAFNAHPDEIEHARAADYYRTNWLPPKLGDPAAASSYSKYGVSYLNDRELVYQLAGKWSTIVAPLVGDINLAYRLFNLTLLAAIAFAFVRKPEARPLIVPLALSAQVWYVFSYFNGDAFALAVALFTAFQITARGSAFNAALDADSRVRWLKGVIALGIGLGLLLLTKRNYYVFIAFLFAYVALKEIGLRASLAIAFGTLLGVGWYFGAPADVPAWLYACAALAAGALVILDTRPRLSDAAFRRRLGTFLAAAAVGLALFLPRVAFDKLVLDNPANVLSNAVTTAEVFATDGFKPSQIAENKAFWGLHLRQREVPYLTLLFAAPHWLWLTFQSSVGVYGYMDIVGPAEFYVVTAIVYLALFASMGYGASRPGDRNARYLLVIAGVYAALAVLVSSLFSWIFDYQAQGRYLFPALVMFGMALVDIRGRLPPAACVAAALAFVLAAWSFYDVGLALIPKA